MINKQKFRHKTIITKIAPVLTLLILFWITAAYPSVLEKENIVAEINGKFFTHEELLKQYDLFLVMSQTHEQYREKITLESYLDRYILEILMLQEANRIGISAVVPDEVLLQQKQIYLSATGQTEDTLSANLHKAGFSMKDAERFFEKNLIINTLNKKVFGDIEISDEEARKFYSDNPGYFNVPDKIMASHILICHRESQGCTSKLTRQEAKKSAESIRNLATPEKFAELAKQYSMDNTAKDGGSLGFISKGMAMQAFENAAFKLDIGEISDPVETNYGFHIIYVTDKQGIHVTTFEEARESIKEKLKGERTKSLLGNYLEELQKKANIKVYPIVDNKAVNDKEAEGQGSPVTGRPVSPDGKFQTFDITGQAICKNDAGLPIIILFSLSDCSHCRWIGDTFDNTVMEYADNDLIEAHHYDVDTKDDLLTAAVETEIPKDYIKIYERGNPKGYVPRFSFGCKYDRIGNRYEKGDDFASEAWEFRQVIDALLKENNIRNK